MGGLPPAGPTGYHCPPGHQGDFLVFWLIWFWPGRVFPWCVGRYYSASLLRIALTNSMHGVRVWGKHAKSTSVAKGYWAFFMRITVWARPEVKCLTRCLLLFERWSREWEFVTVPLDLVIIGPRDVTYVQAVKDSVGPFSDSWPWARDGVLCNLFHVLAHGRHRGVFSWKGR